MQVSSIHSRARTLETELPYHHFSLRPYKSLHSVRTAEGGCQMAHRANTPLRGEMSFQ